MTTFVLVHGAWHGGWCWHKVVKQLEAMGHKAIAPDMPGRGGDAMPIAEVTMDDITRRVRDVVEAQDEKVVLVGHSYGGAIITQAAEYLSDKIKSLAYVTAFLLGDGETMMAMAETDAASRLGGNLEMSADHRTASVRSEVLRECFYGESPDEDVRFAKARLGLEALAGFQTPMRTTRAKFGSLPRTYIECTKDQAISIDLQRRLHGALPCERVVTLETDHSPFFSAPQSLSAALAKL